MPIELILNDHDYELTRKSVTIGTGVTIYKTLDVRTAADLKKQKKT